MIVSLICIIAMGSGVVIYFIQQAVSSPYGHRLEGIENYNIELSKIEDYYKENKDVQDVKVELHGKIIYENVTVSDKVNNESIQSMATNSLEVLTEEQKNFYDIQFIFKREAYNPYLGSKSASNKVISWANYSYDVTTTTTTKKKK